MGRLERLVAKVMTAAHAVLLIPGPFTNLLDPGSSGARPPTAGRFDGVWYFVGDAIPGDPDSIALVLARNEQVDRHGIAWLCVRQGVEHEIDSAGLDIRDGLRGQHSLFWLRKFGTVVLLDETNREVQT